MLSERYAQSAVASCPSSRLGLRRDDIGRPRTMQRTSHLRWSSLSAPRLVLINPPEGARRYSDGVEVTVGTDSEPRSVLGGKGEWKVASPDSSHWLSIDLGSVRHVHSIVVQCGALGRSFSGWVTKIKVQHSMTEGDDEWTELDRDLVTTCNSDPAREHVIELREPVWMRHVKLTPTGWKVSAALSTGENLEPHISMRSGVMASPHRASDAEAVREMTNQAGGGGASLVAARAGTIRAMSAGSPPRALFNLHAGETAVSGMDDVDTDSVTWALATSAMESRRLPLRLLRVDDHAAAGEAALSPVVGALVLKPRADERGEGQLESRVDVPEKDWQSEFCKRRREQLKAEGFGKGDKQMIHERALLEWSDPSLMDALKQAVHAYVKERERAGEHQLEYDDTWLPASEYLSSTTEDHGTACAPEECGARVGDSGQLVNLLPSSESMVYCCTLGTRVALPSADRSDEATGSVVAACASSGRVLVAVDNTRALRSFHSWASAAMGRHADTWMRSLPYARVAPSPRHLVQAACVHYVAGTRLTVLREDGAWVDATVVAWWGAEHGTRHSLTLNGLGREVAVDLNDVNHAPQRFDDMRSLAHARAAYIERVLADGSEVEDAITGRRLLIEKQLLSIRMAVSSSDLPPVGHGCS